MKRDSREGGQKDKGDRPGDRADQNEICMKSYMESAICKLI